MSHIQVLVAATSLDMTAEGISAAIAQREDMTLIENRIVAITEVARLLDEMPLPVDCAVILVGPHAETETSASSWLAQHKELVVLRVDILGDLVRYTARDIGMDSLFAALQELVNRSGFLPSERVSQFQFHPSAGPIETSREPVSWQRRPVLRAAIEWVHATLCVAVDRLAGKGGDLHGLTLTSATVSDSLHARPALSPPEADAGVEALDAALTRALLAEDATVEPLVIAARALDLHASEIRVVVLALAVELDSRYQRSFGLLTDDLGRRAGTLGLFLEMLGEPAWMRHQLARAAQLARWRILDGQGGGLPTADEAVRLDGWLREWLLGDHDALGRDPRVQRVTRRNAWAGAALLDREQDRISAIRLVSRLQAFDKPDWIALAGDQPASWRAMLELGARALHLSPIRIDLARLAGLDVGEIEETAIRLARMARLVGSPVIVDATGVDGAEQDAGIKALLAVMARIGRPAAVISHDVARIARLLGSASYDVEDAKPLVGARTTALRAAARGAGASLTQAAAEAIVNRYSLQVDGLEHAMRLARTRSSASGGSDARGGQFLSACKDVSAEGTSQLAERIEPLFKLDDVVLPPDRKQQLEEIVANIQLAHKVLEGWKFGNQLPYGRGVTALFHGPSGTGKTMAALGVAERLGVQILRIDLSRVVSKYIGDTEKNIDRVFADAEKSGAALLIDEADALFGRRSEVKDAHDRYANIEVAFLLQRMEAYAGLAILTTNLRQNLDPSFLRRLRFIVDFPKPDASAREKIWRQCLPDDSHALDDAAFRQLARKIDLSGGHIRQITLRAAFIAATGETMIGLNHIAQAGRAEFAKLGLPPVEIILPEGRKAA